MKTSYVIGALLVVVVCGLFILRLYNKPHRNPASESAISIDAIELFNKYEIDEAASNKLYLDKVVEVKGKISEISANQESSIVIVLESENPVFGIRCTMEDHQVNAHVGDLVAIKGICTGYLSDVIIVKGSIVK